MTNRPNILLITSDQQHWNTLGKHFSEIKTPNLDRLAAEGVDFRRAYCPNPTCTPSRASLITGQYPSRHGAWSLGTKLPESAETVGDLLGKAGYRTSLIGKAHFQPLISTERWPSLESYPLLRDLNFWRNFNGPFYGFEHVELARNHGDETHAGQHYALWMEEKGLKDWQKHFQNRWGDMDFTDGGPVHPAQHGAWTLPEEFHMNAWITERSIARIDRCAEEGAPFFLWASYFDPHPPYLVPEPWASMYDPSKLSIPAATEGEHADSPPFIRKTQEERPDFSEFRETPHANHGLHSHRHSRAELAKDIAIYYGMISMMDHYIGKLLDHLDQTGQRENTLIVFTSDHGHFYGQHGLVAKGPFHYEDAIRVPMIASQPGTLPQGIESTALQTLVDFPVTFLEAAGVEVPWTMQGRNQLPVWEGRTDAVRDQVIVEHHHQPTAIHVKTLVEERWKLTLFFRRDYGELYDLEKDPGEIRNLWDDPAHAQIRAKLTERLLFAEMDDEPIPMPRVSAA